MRIPQTEARRQLDPGGVRPARVVDAIGPALRSVGGQLSALGQSYVQQEEAAQNMSARQGFLEFQNQIDADYRQSMQDMPEGAQGHYDSWFVGIEGQPARFQQSAAEFISTLPPRLQAEYQARLTAYEGDFTNRVASDELKERQRFATDVIERQVQAASLTVSQDPSQLDAQITDIVGMVNGSGLPGATTSAIARAAQEQLAMIAAQGEIGRDPEGFRRRLDGYLTDYTSSGSPIDRLVEQIVQVESGGSATARNPRSSATGAGQFISETWLAFIREQRPDLEQGRSRAQILALRNDPAISREAVAWYARSNERDLQAAGLPVTAGTLYLAHFAGPQGAVDVLQANPSASAESVLGSAVVRANPFLRGKTAGWVVDWAARKMDETEGPVTRATSDDPILNRMSPNQIAQLPGMIDARTDALQAAQTQELATIKDDFNLRIATGDVTLTEDDILSSPLDSGDQASLIRSFRSANGDRRETAAYVSMLQEGGEFDPFDSGDRQGVSRAYDSIVNGRSVMRDADAQHVAQRVYERSGIVPQRVHNELRQAARSTDPQIIATAGQIALNFQTIDPGGLTVRDGGSEIERLATQFGHYTRNLDYSADQAGEIIASLNDPQQAARREAVLDSEPVRSALDGIGESQVLNVFDTGIFDVLPPSQLGETAEASAVMVGEYQSIMREEIVGANGDLDLAKTLADQRFRSIYGASDLTLAGDRTVTRYPPETVYQPVGGSHDYVREQLMEAVEQERQDPDGDPLYREATDDQVRLHYSDITEQTVQAGQLARYQIWVQAGGVWENTGDFFFANPSVALERWREENPEREIEGPTLEELEESWQTLRDRRDEPGARRVGRTIQSEQNPWERIEGPPGSRRLGRQDTEFEGPGGQDTPPDEPVSRREGRTE